EDGQVGSQCLEMREHVDTASTWHRDIQDHQIPLFGPELRQRLFGGSGPSDTDIAKLAFQDLLQAASKNGVIVDNEDPDHWRWSSLPASGILTITVVPAPGVLSITSSPPRSNARSFIPSIPNDWRPKSRLSSIPRPLSRTSKATV